MALRAPAQGTHVADSKYARKRASTPAPAMFWSGPLLLQHGEVGPVPSRRRAICPWSQRPEHLQATAGQSIRCRIPYPRDMDRSEKDVMPHRK